VRFGLQRAPRFSEAQCMQRRALAIACLLWLAASLGGCWVIDEIDKGQKFLDEHSPKAAKEKTETEEKAAAGAAKNPHAVDAYFAAEAKQGTTKTFTPGQVSEGIVACKLGRKTEFMTRENCAARGGRS
jgi:hypothetical protein